MSYYESFYNFINTTDNQLSKDTIRNLVEEKFNNVNHGDFEKWINTLNSLPKIKPSKNNFNSQAIEVGIQEDCDSKAREDLESKLKQLRPWRKGPFSLFDIYIDTEWRSDLKWDRLTSHISSLEGKMVLDIGCGSGYHCWRMLGEGARGVLGVDPTWLYVIQFLAVQSFANCANIAVLPLGIDDIKGSLKNWDSVFSMGLLYHRRSPLDHLIELKDLLKKEGELILETLIIDGGSGDVLSPKDRYAKMPNVWFIPSILTLESWLRRVGFKNIRCIDSSETTSEEQRATGWIQSHSLENFLDPNDSSKTIEGYPAPKRAIFLANK